MTTAIKPPPPPTVAIQNHDECFPVHRIYCVGRNYAEHVQEMGGQPKNDLPVFFMKPADAVVVDGSAIPYPPKTNNLHYEAELVIAIGTGGASIPEQAAENHIFGYAVGIDLTRRDLQKVAKDKGGPWDTAKGFDHSAPLSAIRPIDEGGPLSRGRLWLNVNDEIRQDADLSEMIWGIPQIISILSEFYTLMPGDLIFTGTPAGVGPLLPGDTITAGIENVGTLKTHIVSGEDL